MLISALVKPRFDPLLVTVQPMNVLPLTCREVKAGQQ